MITIKQKKMQVTLLVGLLLRSVMKHGRLRMNRVRLVNNLEMCRKTTLKKRIKIVIKKMAKMMKW